MITGAIKSQVDQIWNAFWSGGISNPLEVMEQIRLTAALCRSLAEFDVFFASLQQRALRGEM